MKILTGDSADDENIKWRMSHGVASDVLTYSFSHLNLEMILMKLITIFVSKFYPSDIGIYFINNCHAWITAKM